MPPQLTEHQNSVILSFLKAPRIGYVKTRLARSIGSKLALDVYRKLVERQLSEVPPDYHNEIHFTPGDAFQEMSDWLGKRYEFYPQCEGELGMRLESAVFNAFKRGAKQVICIGGDCPKLNRTYFEETTIALQCGYDVVFGPSEDGGYYLIGLNAPCIQLFQNIPWSTESTLEVSLERSAALNLSVKLLDTLYDVDEVSELNRAVRDGILEIQPSQK